MLTFGASFCSLGLCCRARVRRPCGLRGHPESPPTVGRRRQRQHRCRRDGRALSQLQCHFEKFTRFQSCSVGYSRNTGRHDLKNVALLGKTSGDSCPLWSSWLKKGVLAMQKVSRPLEILLEDSSKSWRNLRNDPRRRAHRA
ncbi:hypothetical protein TNIN_382731 [Trichonephila inaurata madagascariensis]|uniref:Uncharacterized protein n=1 Tax=Trichonephila inaurata madagascariensis TaxID=2747483 RepID=A0A8X6XRS2_9ARAC|nr:hypothetical protein TNIN_382731 [Trichonephila inaurata madagascariensis]